MTRWPYVPPEDRDLKWYLHNYEKLSAYNAAGGLWRLLEELTYEVIALKAQVEELTSDKKDNP